MSTNTSGLGAYSRPDNSYTYATATPVSSTEDRTTKLNQQLETQLQNRIMSIRQRLQVPVASAATPSSSAFSPSSMEEESKPSVMVGRVLDVSV